GTAVGTLFELGSVAILAVLIYVALRMLEVAPFAVLLLLGMFVRVTPSVMLCHHLYRELVQAMPAFENVMGLTARCAAEAEPAGAPPAALEFAGALRLERVSFSYQPDKPPAVRELDLVVPAGEFVALVGTSGAGKSTIADLMCGLLVPAAGRVTIDGAVLDQERARAWRAQVGYVAQDTHLFRGTVRDNLLWARPDAGEAELRAALALAEAAAFVDALPQGLDTPIGERGATISQGERQRLALARALLRRRRAARRDDDRDDRPSHRRRALCGSDLRHRGRRGGRVGKLGRAVRARTRAIARDVPEPGDRAGAACRAASPGGVAPRLTRAPGATRVERGNFLTAEAICGAPRNPLGRGPCCPARFPVP